MAAQDRNLNISISATTAGLERGVGRAEQQLNRLRKSHADAWAAINQAEEQLQRDVDATIAEVTARQEAAQAALEQVGVGLTRAGAALAVGLGFATRSAVQWESAWAGVTKTVEGSAEEMAVLEDGIRGLALEIPVASTELAGIAATAGQLGIAQANIVEFTQTIAAMSVATNLTAEEAAQSMARFANVMGTPQDEIDRLGATIVDLGNNSATTESEILEMGLRIAGAGRTVGLTEADVLSFAAALSSVGLEAEGGGSAISRVMMMISDSVRAGGDDLTAFARAAGVSAEEFATAFRDDPADAIEMFIGGLGQVQQSSEDVFQVLRDVGVVDVEVRDALLRAAGAADVLTESLDLGGEAWEANSALVEEAAARYETTESQIQMALNSINEFGIATGEALLPVIGAAAERVTDWGTAYAELDEDQQDVLAGVGGVTGAVGLLTGALLIGGPRLIEFRDNMATLAESGSSPLRRGLGNVATFLTGPYGAALGGVLALGGLWLDQKAQQIAEEQEWERVLRDSAGALDANVQQHAVQQLQQEGALEAAERAGIAHATVVEALLQEGEARDALAVLYEHDQALRSDDPRVYDAQVAGSERLRGAIEDLLGPGTEWADLTEEQQNGLLSLATTMDGQVGQYETARENAAAVRDATSEVVEEYRTAEEAADAYRESLEALSRTTLGTIDAEVAWEQSIDDASAALEDNGATLDRTTQAGRDNQRALNDLITDGGEYIAMLQESGATSGELREEHGKARDRIYEVARAFGASEEEAEDYASMLGEVPPGVSTDIEVAANGSWYVQRDPERLRRLFEAGAPIGGLADGGAVEGPGGPRDDIIPAMLSNGEHVLPADEVEMAGGQDAVYRLRAMIRSGFVEFADGGAVQRFARGGAVRPRPARIIDDHDEETRIGIQRLIEATVQGIGDEMAAQWKKYANSTMPVVSAWRSQLGVPYSWGGGGPAGPSTGFGRGANTVGFDCSSLMQYGWAKVGVNLPRVTYDQINVGSPVPRGRERPGDLVFPHLGHVAGVETPGTLIHAPYTGATVSRRPMYPAPLAIRRPRRYDTGGIWGPGEAGINLSGRPERVLSPDQTASFDRLVDALTTGQGGAPVAVHIHHVPGYSTPQDIRRGVQHLERLSRSGRPQ